MKISQQLACVLAVVALTVEVHGRHLATHFQECQSDPNSHVDPALLQKGLRGELADLTPIGPHVLCMNVKKGLQHENGDIREGILTDYLSAVPDRNRSLVNRVVAECGHRNGAAAQQAALTLLSCIHRIIPNEEDDRLDCPSRNEIDEAKYFAALKGAHNDDALLDRYVFCNNLRDGTQKRNGDISADGIRASLTGPGQNNTALDIITRECGQRKGVTIEEAAWGLSRCIYYHINAMEPEPEHHRQHE